MDEPEPDWHRVIEAIVDRTLAELDAGAGRWWRFCHGRAFSNYNTAAGAVERVTVIAELLIRDGILRATARPLLRLSAVLPYAAGEEERLRKELALRGVAFDRSQRRFFLEEAETAVIAEASTWILDDARVWWKRAPAGVLAAVGQVVEARRSALGLEGWATLGEVEPDAETLLVACAAVAPYYPGNEASPVDLRRLFGDDVRAAEDREWRHSEWRRRVLSALDLARRSSE